jgi:hypothetical protein
LAFGAVVMPGSWRVEMRGVLVKPEVGVVPCAADGCRTTAAVTSTANAPNGPNLVRIMCAFVGDWGLA